MREVITDRRRFVSQVLDPLVVGNKMIEHIFLRFIEEQNNQEQIGRSHDHRDQPGTRWMPLIEYSIGFHCDCMDCYGARMHAEESKKEE